MNRPRDPQGRYIKSKSNLSTKVPSDLFGGRNVFLVKSADRYQKTGASSTQRDKIVSKETNIGSTIKQEIEASIILGQEARPLEPSAKPNNTAFAFTPPPGNPNFKDIIDLEQVNLLFGSSANVIISQIDTETLAPIISTDSSRVLDIQSIGRPFHQRETLLSSKIKPPRYSLFGNKANMDDQEDHNNVRHREEEETRNQTETTFGFIILDTTLNVNMKNIPLSALPTFYGKKSEDPDTFLFEFDILCRSYNYIQYVQKLKLFPATLKDFALRWFMGLGESSIRSWEAMKDIFLKNYQDYCKTKESRNDIFKI
jgi:hypothetical protein